jgi:hypothetical protein
MLLLEGDWQRAQRRESMRHAIEMRPTAAVRVQSETELTIDDELELSPAAAVARDLSA